MKITAIRKHFADDFTISDVFIDDKFICYFIEDRMREIPGEPVEKWKVQNETAIPAGVYKVIVTPSARFKRPLPLLENVPGFSGVRIHSGNASHNTEGCLLPGETWDGKSNFIGSSKIAFEKLFAKISLAPQCTIEIR